MDEQSLHVPYRAGTLAKPSMERIIKVCFAYKRVIVAALLEHNRGFEAYELANNVIELQ